MALRLIKIALNAQVADLDEKLVLITLADAADGRGRLQDEQFGICAHRAQMSKLTFSRHVDALVGQGLVRLDDAGALQVLPS
jgi:hypothetical protein